VSLAGGGAALVAAMVNCPDDPSVQHFGCWALANLAWQGSGAASARQVGAQGAAEVCRAAARRFPRHAGVVEKAHLALERLNGNA